ncbi:MAG: DNA replication/repair protein RecF [Alphaproteobacteria bacterium]|nr:DNA replication/repair protein RecF [Alphaproteobacteria bacterium]
MPVAADRPRTAVTRLTLSAFRCYGHARVEADRRPLVLTGPNGAGKTNLLEALSFLSPGRGLRRAKLAEIDQHGGSAAWAVATTVAGADGAVEIGTGRDPLSAGGVGRRVVRIDGAPAGQNALSQWVSMLWVTPEMDRLFVDGAGARRRFLDRLVFSYDAAHGSRINAYDHAMRERSRLLRDGAANDSWAGALEAMMAEHGVAIAAARAEVVARLDSAARLGVGPFPRAAIAIGGIVEGWLADMPALAAEDRLRALLHDSRGRDAESGGAADGPHRSDLDVHHVGRNLAAALCSTGEQKALLLSLVLAHARLLAAERAATPILLLDEVAAHLDRDRRAALFDEICALDMQAWLTGTDDLLFEAFGTRANRLSVENATISAAA